MNWVEMSRKFKVEDLCGSCYCFVRLVAEAGDPARTSSLPCMCGVGLRQWLLVPGWHCAKNCAGPN
jgi:hypothetical protein